MLERIKDILTKNKTYKVLSNYEAQIIAAMGSAMIPAGGTNFTLGAKDLAPEWLLRTDHLLALMPWPTRWGLKLCVDILNYAWPLIYLRKNFPLTAMEEQERTELLHLIENSPYPGPLSILIIKQLVFPAFYSLPAVKAALGLQGEMPCPPTLSDQGGQSL